MPKSKPTKTTEDFPGQTYGYWPKELVEATGKERPAPVLPDPNADNIDGHWLDCTRDLRPISKAMKKPDPA